MSKISSYDVVIVGGGNAALTAAIAAAEQGSSTLIVEKAPMHLRGGNTYFSGGLFRFSFSKLEELYKLLHDTSVRELQSINIQPYPTNEFYTDMMSTTEGLTDPNLLQVLVSESYPTMSWMHDKGIPWILAYGRQSFVHNGETRFWGGLIIECVGGGKGLSDTQFELASKAGVEIKYQAEARSISLDAKGYISGIELKTTKGYQEIPCKSLVLACGGFESNSEMRTRYLGTGWDLVKVRGTRFNTGDGINMALNIGAEPHGHWSGCHAVAWDLNAPPYGDRNIADLFQKHSYPFGLIVNINGERFIDEGADFRNYTYAKYGKEILKQPKQIAIQLFDQRTKHLLRDEYNIPQATVAEADTLKELAIKLDIDSNNLARTVDNYNNAVQTGDFNPTILDGKRTLGIKPPKSNWALPLDSPPYVGYAVTCGITFTFGGLKIDTSARVLDTSGNVIVGLYAAGELASGLFYNNYPGGSGLMAGAVFGKIAGMNAADSALNSRSR